MVTNISKILIKEEPPIGDPWKQNEIVKSQE